MSEIKKELTVAEMLGCTLFPLIIEYNDGKNKYVEHAKKYWEKFELDSNGNVIYNESSFGAWEKFERDTNGNILRCEYSNGDWMKFEYDSNGNQIYFENSDGNIEDNRTKVELSLKEIADKFGIPLSQLRVKE